MISPAFFTQTLQSLGISFFAGVPDSLLKSLCAYLKVNVAPADNITAANEGGAMALAAGHFLATGKPACVYMQNSGIGNAVNPLLSLLDSDVYSIPALLVIGWRGMPGVHDEPQHVKQGRVTTDLLDAMEMPYTVLADNEADARRQIEMAVSFIKDTGRQMALIVRKGTFEPYSLPAAEPSALPCREEAIRTIISSMPRDTAFVGTTGMISRELFELRVSTGTSHESDFLTVGSMGHASQIALAIALAQPRRHVACLDGDGAFIMHTGGATIIGSLAPRNLLHFVLNNGAHDSVGGQDTVGFRIDIPAIARACGYAQAACIDTLDNLQTQIAAMLASDAGPNLLEVKVRKGARPDLGRPTTTPIQNRDTFMSFLHQPINR